MDKIIAETSKNDWYILCSQNTKTPHHCICGHYVKRITYIYNKSNKNIMLVGTTCIKKYGIKQHLKNGILLLTIKNIIDANEFENKENMIVINDFCNVVKESIQKKYLEFQEKIKVSVVNGQDIDYYDIVAPFRRLLNDVCYLVTEYN